MNIEPHRTLLEPHDLTFLAGAPYLYHCHHYNLFHDQTVDDIMGDELGPELRRDAAQAAFHDLLRALCDRLDLRTPSERITLAQAAFAAAGHGRLELDVSAAGGVARGSHLHYGYAWHEKYGASVRAFLPADAVAAGFSAAAVEVAFDLPVGSLGARETECVALRASNCVIEIAPRTARTPEVRRIEHYREHLAESRGGLHEEAISTIADALQGFVLGVGGDARGLVEAFGVFVTLHLANYYNATAFRAIRHVEKERPAATTMAESLLREAGHVCVFNTFGGILLSPEWEAVSGPLQGDPEEIVIGSMAIARGLGFGRWSIREFQVGKRLVLATTSNYEAPYWLSTYGQSRKPRCYFFHGSALATMVLAHRVSWKDRPALTQSLYDDLFRGAGLGFELEVTRSLTMGDAETEVVVSASA